jgi:hypothetical protein
MSPNGRGLKSRALYRAKLYVLRGHAAHAEFIRKRQAEIDRRHPELRQTALDQASAGDGRHAVLVDSAPLLKAWYPDTEVK